MLSINDFKVDLLHPLFVCLFVSVCVFVHVVGLTVFSIQLENILSEILLGQYAGLGMQIADFVHAANDTGLSTSVSPGSS